MSASPAARPVPGLNDLDEAEIERLYGRSGRFSPADVLELLHDAPFRWWIAGGWAIEAATRKSRQHWDTDVVVLWRDLEAEI
jgi:Aminoglycoside-2''-adenylyltransferase